MSTRGVHILTKRLQLQIFILPTELRRRRLCYSAVLPFNAYRRMQPRGCYQCLATAARNRFKPPPVADSDRQRIRKKEWSQNGLLPRTIWKRRNSTEHLPSKVLVRGKSTPAERARNHGPPVADFTRIPTKALGSNNVTPGSVYIVV